MVLITNKGSYVKVDLTAFISSNKVDYSVYYVMKDKTQAVRLEKNNEWVEVELSSGQILQLDQTGQKGMPVTIDGNFPLTNLLLAEEIAQLKNL